MLVFVFVDVVLECEEETLCMFWGHDDPVAYLRLLDAGEHGREIYHEFAVRMGDDSEV